MFDPIQIRYSKRKALWGLAFGLVVSLMIFSSPSRGRWAWTFYGVLLLFNNIHVIKALFHSGTVLTIDDQGICDLRLGSATIPWGQIESVSQHHGQRIFLNVSAASQLGLEESLVSILYKPISQIGTDGVVIDARGLEFDSDDLAGIIADRLSYHRENRHH